MRIILLLVFSAAFLRGEDWSINGHDYHNVKVGTVEADRVHISYDGGIGTVNLVDMPPDLQKRFSYNPAAAKSEASIREQTLEANISEAKLQTPAAQPTPSGTMRRISGTVLAVFKDGLLVSCSYVPSPGVSQGGQITSNKTRHYSEDALVTQINGKGTSTAKTGSSAPFVYGTFLVVGAGTDFADNDKIDVIAVEEGVNKKSLTTDSGATISDQRYHIYQVVSQP